MSPLSPGGNSHSAPCSPARREAADGEDTTGLWSPAKSLHRPRRGNFREQADSRGQPVQKGKCLCSLHHWPHRPFSPDPCGSHSNVPVPTALLLPTHHPSPASKPTQMEELWKKSPRDKLEQLKKRIQEQKLKQRAASREQQSLVSASAKDPLPQKPLRRKVCRVVSAPPAPLHRVKDQRERSSAQRTQTQSQKQPSPKSSALQRAAVGKGAKLPGASAWREGQKLARKLLGPPPLIPNLRSMAEEQSTANTSDPGEGFTAMPGMAKSSREKENEPVGKSPELKSCMVPPSKPVERVHKEPAKDIQQILRNLHLQSQSDGEHSHTRLSKDTVKGRVEVLQQHLGIQAPCPGLWVIAPSASTGGKKQSSVRKDGAKPSSSGNCSRGKTTSQRQRGSSSPVQKGPEKENLKQPSKRRVNISKPHPYSPESVQEFILRKQEERKKKNLEEKKSLVQAMKVRSKRLQEVYRKQREAVGKKISSGHMCKVLRERAPLAESPRSKAEQEQSSAGSLERSFMAWVDKPSCAPLSRDHRGRNQLLETLQSPEKREASASPAPRASSCWLLSPLRCEDLRDCSPPAPQAPPLSFLLPQRAGNPYPKDSSADFSPCRSKEDRVKAIQSLCEELEAKIEVATKRLNEASWVKGFADRTSTEATLDLYNQSAVPEPETSKDEQDRTMTIQMLLDAPDLEELHVSADKDSHGQESSLAHGTARESAQKEIPTALPAGSAASRDLLWIVHSSGQRHLNAGGDPGNIFRGFPVNKGPEVDTSLLNEKPITSTASSSHPSLARSLQRELAAQRSLCGCGALWEAQNQEGIATQSSREGLRTPSSLGIQLPAHHGSEQHFGEGDPHYTTPEEKHRSHLKNLRQTSLLLAHRLKVHQLQQKEQLTVLREKAQLEIQESQRFLNLLEHSSEECSYPSVPRLDHVEQTWSGCQLEGANTTGSNEKMHPLKQSEREMEGDQSPVNPKGAGEGKALGWRGSYCSVLPGFLSAEHDQQTPDEVSPPVNHPCGEACAGASAGESSEWSSSSSQWSEVGQHYGGSSTFCSFSLAMLEQCLRGEELRARHQAALLKLRKKALREKARAELAWLGHQKRCLENLQDNKGASAMAAQQHKILTELKQEQAEIQHLQNIYRAAHQERKLLLKQQREILKMKHSTAQLQEKMLNLAGKQELLLQSPDVLFTRSPATGEAIKLKTMRLLSSPKLCSSSAESTAHPERPDLAGNREGCVQLKNKQSKKVEGSSTENKKSLGRYQKVAEESPVLEQPPGLQGPDASETVAKEVCCDSSQSTGSGCKDGKNTVKEVEKPVPDEIHQVDGSHCSKHLDHISHEASDERLNLKAFSEGLTLTEPLSKSNNFSLNCEGAKSASSLSEFQKVSAVWMEISESSVSDSELELKNGEDTDVSILEEFGYDSGDVFPKVSRETLKAEGNGKEMFPTGQHYEHEVPKDDSSETSSPSQKYPGEVSDHGCTEDLLPFRLSAKANASRAKSAGSSQGDNPARGMDEPPLDTSENHKTCSQQTTKHGQDAVASSSSSDDIDTPKVSEEHKPDSTTSRVKKDVGADSLFVDHRRDLAGFLLTGSPKHLDLVTNQLRNAVSFPPAIKSNKLPCLSSLNLAVSGGKDSHAQLSNEKLTSSKLSTTSTCVSGISEEVQRETSSSESLPRAASGNQGNSAERQAIKEARKRQLFHAENCSSKGEEDTIFMSDEGLPPTAEDALSEILSPVDEVLSYGSADLPSSSKKDLSFPSEDLPPPPLGADAMKTDDSTFSMDDFPSPPEPQTVNEDLSLQMGVGPPLADHTLPEAFPLLNQETTGAFPPQFGSLSEKSLPKGIPSVKEDCLEHQQEEHENPWRGLEVLPVSNPVSSDEISKSPEFTMKHHQTYLTLPTAEEDSGDPLVAFDIGDRVLVKQTQPGTLKFKGQTCFGSGHWAGVALDKAEGDNAGTYRGVKYFECAQGCGIFVRPEEISRLWGADEKTSSSTGDEDSDSEDDEFFKRDCKYPEDKQGEGLTEQKAEDTNSAGGSEVKENQCKLHSVLLSGKGQKLLHSDQSKCNEFLSENNLMCIGSEKEKPQLTDIKQRTLADMLPVKSETGHKDMVNTSKNVCCWVKDHKRNKLADDLASELCRKLLFDTLIALPQTAQHKYKSAFEKDTLNYGKGLRREGNQELFLLKENPSLILSEPKVSDVLLCDLDSFGIRGCQTVAEKIVAKFVDDAVKEYKKIKRKHGSEADKILHLSSETSPTTLPLLRKILDAGVFGSSEDFDQPHSDQHKLVRQPPKHYLYKLDQWHSAPWKRTVEVPLVIPHYTSYVKKLSARAVEELWTPENICSNFRRISVPKNFGCNDLQENDLEMESTRMYNQVLFDLTRELLSAEYQVSANPNTPPWMKEKLGSCCSRGHCRRRDLGDVKMFVQDEIIKMMNLEKNDLEMKRKFLNMTKYGNCKRDRVDLILIQELHKEEPQWTYYDDDELTVKMRVTEDIFDTLISDTIRVLNKISLRKARD